MCGAGPESGQGAPLHCPSFSLLSKGRVDLVDLLCEVGLVLLGVLLVFRLLPSGCMRGREEVVSAAGEHGEEDW